MTALTRVVLRCDVQRAGCQREATFAEELARDARASARTLGWRRTLAPATDVCPACAGNNVRFTAQNPLWITARTVVAARLAARRFNLSPAQWIYLHDPLRQVTGMRGRQTVRVHEGDGAKGHPAWADVVEVLSWLPPGSVEWV